MKAKPKFAGELSPALQKVLRSNVRAKAAFERLPPSHRNEYEKWIAEAKKSETVERRLKKLVSMLLAKATN